MGYNLVNDSSSRLSQLKVVNWGRTDYTEALERQLKLVEQRKAGTVSDHLIFTEHPPTFTIGKRSNAKKILYGTSQGAHRRASRSSKQIEEETSPIMAQASWYATQSYHLKHNLTCTNTLEAWNRSSSNPWKEWEFKRVGVRARPAFG